MMALEDPPAALCRCGIVWLPSYALAFAAEGREHTRASCRATS